ncbi:MAG: IS110 family transposase [Sphingobium sp.]
MSDALWAGLDIGDYTSQICITDDDGTTLIEEQCPTSPQAIADILARLPPSRYAKVGMEAASMAPGIARFLIDREFPVALYDARRIHKFLSATTNKTDVNDARGIALVTRLGKHGLREVHIKSQIIQELRSEIVLRDTMVRQRMAAESSLRAAFRVYGVKPGPFGTKKLLVERAEAGFAQLGAEFTERFLPLLRLCESIRDYITFQDQALLRRAQENDVTRRFMEIPSVGPICAMSFYTAIEDPERFGRGTDVGAYLGLTPKIRQSGTGLKIGKVGKCGNKLTRSHLVMSGRAMLNRNLKADCFLKHWGTEIAARRGISKARVAVARKLAVVMLSMWRNNTSFDPKGLAEGSR